MVRGKVQKARLKFTRQILCETKILVKILKFLDSKTIKISIKIHYRKIIFHSEDLFIYPGAFYGWVEGGEGGQIK